ncbi:MAG: GNAT family N-acetyltransferase [Parasphingorhabdus sp.]
MNPLPAGYELTEDQARIDVIAAHDFLKDAYWSKNIPLERLRRALDGSFCLAIFHEQHQVAMARLITDYATFSYLSDVYVLKEHRGRGLAQAMVSYYQNHPKLDGQRIWLLFTRDAHGVYEKLGWKTSDHPERLMIRLDESVYE